MDSGSLSALTTFSLQQYVKDLLLLVAPAAFLVALAALVVAWRNYHAGVDRDLSNRYFKMLQDESSRNRTVAELSQKNAYEAWIAYTYNLKKYIDEIYGENLSIKSIRKILSQTSLIPITFFALAWLFGSVGNFAEIEILPRDLNFFQRLIFLMSSAFAGFVYKSAYDTITYVKDENISNDLRSQSSETIHILSENKTRWIPGKVEPLGEFPKNILDKIILILSKFPLLLAASVVGKLIQSAVIFDKNLFYNLFFLMAYFIIMPALAAVFSFASWFPLRNLIDKADWISKQSHPALYIFMDTFVMFSYSIVLLCLFVVFTGFILDSLNELFASTGKNVFDWRSYLAIAKSLPFLHPSNWLNIGVFLPIIAPLAIHLVTGLSGVVFSFQPDGRALAARIIPGLSEIEQQELAADIHHFRKRRRVFAIILTPLILIALLWLLWITLGAWLPSLYDLADRSAAFWRR